MLSLAIWTIESTHHVCVRLLITSDSIYFKLKITSVIPLFYNEEALLVKACMSRDSKAPLMGIIAFWIRLHVYMNRALC